MIRTLLYTSTAALALAALGFVTPANAGHKPKHNHGPYPHVPPPPPIVVERPVPVFVPPPPPPRPVCRAWKVSYRSCRHDLWQCYGVFKDYDDARCAARELRHGGYQTDIDYFRQ